MRRAFPVTSLLLPCIFGSLGVSAWQAQCESFAPALNSTVSIISSSYHPSGTLVNLTSGAGTIVSSSLPAFCRVTFTIVTNTTAGSFANSEVWLPDTWNNRILGVGNGGFNGGVVYGSISYDGINQGYATYSTNTGHNSSSINGSWALHNDNAQVDFAWRAMHLTTVTSKSLVAAYYSQPQFKSYYLGCSTGGRQGISAMERFADDFDGAVIGSPATSYAGLGGIGVKQYLDVAPVNSSRWISFELWEFLHGEILKQCDAIDGVVDGIISNPTVCPFRPESVACTPSSNASQCLTLPQIEAFHNLYSDYYVADDVYVFAGYSLGGEIGYASGLGNAGPVVSPLPVTYWQNFVFNDSSWDYTTYNYTNFLLGKEIDNGGAETTTNLTAFAASGGKILHYVGWADNVIAPRNSIRFYDAVSSTIAAETALNSTDVYRLFTVPGMTHCQGGDGANAFGGEGQRNGGTPTPSNDPDHDILAALVSWVEDDREPNAIIATKWVNNNATLGVSFTRKLCPYPQEAVFQGGNQNSSDSFVCQ